MYLAVVELLIVSSVLLLLNRWQVYFTRLCRDCCSEDPVASISERISDMSETFSRAYTRPCNQMPPSQSDFAHIRLHCATLLYYKILESILVEETKKLQKRAPTKPVDLSVRPSSPSPRSVLVTRQVAYKIASLKLQ